MKWAIRFYKSYDENGDPDDFILNCQTNAFNFLEIWNAVVHNHKASMYQYGPASKGELKSCNDA